MLRLLTLIALTLPSSALGTEGWVALLNVTEKPVTFRLDHGKTPGAVATLGPREVRAVPAGRSPTLRFSTGQAEAQFRVEPFGAYAFVPNAGRVGFQGVELAAAMPPPDDVSPLPAARPTLKVPVQLACDNAEVHTRAVWEARTRALVAQANTVLEPQAHLTLEVVGVSGWQADPQAKDLTAALQDLTQKVPAKVARLVIGFTPNLAGYEAGKNHVPQFAAVTKPLAEHILLREELPRTESGRAEVLVQAVGRWLGAAGAPDTQTVMRPKLGDGLAGLTKFRVQFDPFNALAVNLVGGQLRSGARSLDQLSPADRARLEVLYQTILKAKAADPATVDALALLGPNAPPPAAVAAREPLAPEPPAKPSTPAEDPRRAAIRTVVSAIRLRAIAVRELPPGERPRADALTDDLVRAAAEVATTSGGPHAAAALAVGLGLGLDDSTTLRDNLITRDLARAVETDAEFKERTAALGRPTVRGRRDLCQHFALSCALTEIVGAKGAELAGLTKELRDLSGESGFSFVDLLADFAGIAFAQKILNDPAELNRLSSFRTVERVPPTEGLRENLTTQRFEADYGSLSDPRLKAALADVQERVTKHLAVR